VGGIRVFVEVDFRRNAWLNNYVAGRIREDALAVELLAYGIEVELSLRTGRLQHRERW
jgi:hypothetical protein